MNPAQQQLEQFIFGKQTVLEKIYRVHGNSSLFDYANSWPLSPGTIHPIFLKHFRLSAEKLYGHEMAAELCAQLQAQPLLSTIDHHGLLNHPFFLNSNLIFSLKEKQKYLICLPTAGVSINNSSWPAGFSFTNLGTLSLDKLGIFSDKHKNKTVLAMEKYSPQAIEALVKKIKSHPAIVQKDLFASLAWESLAGLEDKKNFSEQACLASFKLWQKYFPKAAKVAYVPLEPLISGVLAELLADQDSIFYQLFCTETGLNLIEEYFTGLQGAFSKNFDRGSFLFWALGEDGRRVTLRRQDMAADKLSGLLQSGKIYPTSLVCFLVLLFSNATCLGGFNQTGWLTVIKNKFADVLRSMGAQAEADSVSRAVTDNFAEANLAFLSSADKIYKASGVDIYLQQAPELYQKYLDLAKTLTVGESIQTQLPEIYKVITPANQRLPELSAVTEGDILQAAGIKEKISQVMA